MSVQIGRGLVVAQQDQHVLVQRRRARVAPVDVEGRALLPQVTLPREPAVHVDGDQLAIAEPCVDKLAVGDRARRGEVVFVVRQQAVAIDPAPDGGLPVCFNPYLETDLGPTKAYVLDGKTYPLDPTAGTRSNCMNCHRRAGYPAFEADNPTSANFGRVFNDGFRAPDDPYFAPLVKTDFLWSIALKAVATPKR